MIYPMVPFPVTFNLDLKVTVTFMPIDALNAADAQSVCNS